MFMVANVVNAQGVNVGVDASLDARVNADRGAGASVNANANATATDNSSDEEASSRSGADANASTASDVSLKARAIRGWSESEKTDFLLTVKSHAELQSGQDLDNFAKGVLARDESVESVVASENRVRVGYKLPAKFLGLFGTELSAVTDVTFDSEGNAPEKVKVNYPWYRMFFSLDEDIRAEVLQEAVEMNVENDTEVNANSNIHARNGRVIQLISSIFKNIRASVEAEVETETSAEANS